MAGRGELLGEGYVQISVEENLDRELAAADAKLDRAMRDIGRKSATAKVKVDVSELESGLRDSKAAIAKYQQQVDDLTESQKKLSGTEKEANARRIEQLKAEQALEQRVADATKNRIELAKESARLNKQAAAEERLLDQQRAASERREAAGQAARLRLWKETNKQRDKQFALAGRQFLEDERRAKQQREELARIPQIQQKYTELEKTMVKLNQQRRRFTIAPIEAKTLDIQINALNASLTSLEDRARAAGHEITKLDHDADSGAQTLSRWVSSITEASVRLGPFTTSVGTAIKLMAALSPVIVGLVGSLGALAAAGGAGLVGSMGLGFAVIAGGIPVIAGLMAALRPVTADYKVAKSAADAYAKEVLKTGKNSDKAKEKYKQLQHVLKTMDPSARKAFEGFAKLRTEWDKSVSGPAEKAFGSILESGVKSLSGLVSGPTGVAAQTKTALSTIDKGVSGLFKRMSSAGGKQVLGNLMSNFNSMLGPAIAGIGNLAAATGKWLSAFSNFMPGLASQFERWSSKVNESASDSSRLGDRVAKLADSAKSLGVFLSGATRWLSAFFGAGVGPGSSFLRDMGEDLTRLSLTMDRSKTQSFFSDSISMTKNLYSALRPLVALFTEFATILAPAASAMLKVATAVGNVVAAFAGFGPTRALIQGAFAVFITGTLVGKIAKTTEAFRALRASIVAAGAAGAAARLGQVGAEAVGMGGIGGRFRALEAARKNVPAPVVGFARGAVVPPGTDKAIAASGSKAAKAAASFKNFGGAIGSATLAATGFTPAGLAIGAAAIAGSYGIYKLATRVTDLDKALRGANKASAESKNSMIEAKQAGEGLAYASLANRDAQRQLSRAEKDLATARKDSKTSAADIAALEDAVAMARLNAAGTSRQRTEQMVLANSKLAASSISASEAVVKQTESVKRLNYQLEGMKKQSPGDKGLSTSQLVDKYRNADRDQLQSAQKNVYDLVQKLIPEQEKLNQLTRDAAKAATAYSVGLMNIARQGKGWVEMSKAGAAALAKLQRTGGKSLAMKVATKFEDPRQAMAAARAATDALRQGVSSKVIKVALSTKDAETALLRLKALAGGIQPAKLPIIVQGGKKAIDEVTKINGKRLTPKQARAVLKGGKEALGVVNQINQKKLKNKEARLKVLTGDSMNAIESVGRALAGIQSKDVWLTVNERQGKKIKDSPFGGNRTYSGGYVAHATGSDSKQGMVDRAYRKAVGKKSPSVTGGRFRSPTLLVGEENRSEYVIATNPVYRKRNKKFLREAASEFGMTVIDSAAGGKGNSTIGSFENDQYNVNAGPLAGSLVGRKVFDPKKKTHLPYGATKRKGKKKSKEALLSLRNVKSPYAKRLRDLLDQQEFIEREIDYREGRIEIPSSLIEQYSEDSEGNPLYRVNKAAVTKYKSDLGTIRPYRKSLVDVTREISQTADEAQGPTAAQIANYKSNIALLKRQIKAEEKRQKSPNKAVQKSANARLVDLRAALQTQQTDKGTMSEFYKGLTGVRREAGFDLRVARDEYSNLVAELTEGEGVDAKASNEALDANPKATAAKPGDAASAADSPDAAAQLEQAKGREQAAVAESATLRTSLKAFSSSGDIGTGGYANAFAAASNAGAAIGGGTTADRTLRSGPSGTLRSGSGTAVNPATITPPAASGGTIINVNTLHPGDPRTLSAIASAATSGMGQQSSVQSPRTSSGY